MEELLVADLFCGAGGSSTGAERAVRSLGATMILVCVNHWPVAIKTHQKNHPTARHYIADVQAAKPKELVPEGYLDLLMASPECTHFSRARGGKPVSDQSRMNPWAINGWLTDLDVRCLLVENVPEFISWGPLDDDGHPIPEKKGVYFESWIKSIWGLGYELQWRFLNAADYGDATTRRRFFLIARKDGIPVRWPAPTHFKDDSMEGSRLKWRAAKEIIDWNIKGRSLLDDPKYKKKPLAINTRRRIARGLKKYGGELAPLYINLLGLEPEAGGSGTPKSFVMGKQGHSPAFRPVDKPIQTLTTSGHPWLIMPQANPFILSRHGENGGTRAHGVDKPIPTADCRGAGYLVEPFIFGQQSCSAARNLNQPLMTISTGGAISLLAPQLVVFHGASNTSPVDKPVPALPTKAHVALMSPQLLKYYGTKADTEPIDKPLSTLTTKARFGLMEPVIVQTDQTGGNGKYAYPPSEPLPTIVPRQNTGLAEPVMIQVNHTDGDVDNRIQGVDGPIGTITTKRNIGIAEPMLREAGGEDIAPERLVNIDGVWYILDIRFRMLDNRELARAHSFDDEEMTYEFVGNKAEVTKQIGNSVPCCLAEALVREIFTISKLAA